MGSGCGVHFTKNRCWISKDDGKELDMIRGGGVFFVAARPSKSSSREANTLELNPITAAEVEQAALAKEHAAFGIPGSAAEATLDGDREPARFPQALRRPLLKKERCTKLHGHNVVMLHSDQEPVLAQLLKAVQRRRVKRTLVRHGPRTSQSQGKIENANRVINGVCRMWL